ncbi:hypothetical protein QCA50_011802 [Cerrena zonata]|uniref:Uncharacterized protein n=1 Tax=Cerrena zonata TaxID=2478898 RepID=A0AAW0FXQ2_9APHY
MVPPRYANFGSWTKQACPDSKKCFAIPSISSPGTRVVCTSKANALSLIEATGAKGGIVGLGSNNQTLPLPTTSLPPSATPSTNATSPNEPTVKVVTVTVTAGADSSATPAPTTPAPTITLPPTTRTIDSAGVDSLLSSLSAEGVVFVTAAASATPSGSVPPSGSSDDTLPTATASPSDEMKERERVAIKIAAWRRRISHDS